MRRVLAALLAVALTAIWGTADAQCPDGSPPPCPGSPSRGVQLPVSNSIAVLYFENLSPDSGDAYLAYGLTEEIIARLGRLNRLVVKSQATVRRYRGRAEDPATLGRSLAVAHLVNGTVRRTGSRVRVTVELIRAATGDRLWGERYDRTDTDLLAIEEDISQAVATAVSGAMLPVERASLSARPTRSASAYDRFLRGNYYLAQRNPRSVIRAIQEYEAAIARDPGFNRALARIAFAYGLFHDWEWEYPGLSPESVAVRGLAASQQALRQNPLDSDAWMAHGYLLILRQPRTLEGARDALERAVTLDPRNVDGQDRYGWVLGLLGDDAGAEAAYRRAIGQEPDHVNTFYQLARVSQLGGRLTEAARWLDSAIAIDPAAYFAYGQRGQVRLLLGDPVGARRDGELTLELSPAGYRPYRIRGEMILARAALQMGDSATARERIHRLLREEPLARPTVLEGWYLGMGLVALGERDAAVQFLERVQPRGAKLWFGLRMPEFDALRAHPGFQRLVAEARPPTGAR
jgi:TolB-like protein/cytochrome c-type biogenesis protein CcmH/NrfG